jgi:hypothetical protein
MTNAAPAAKKDDYEEERKRLAREHKALEKVLAGSGSCMLCFISNPFMLQEHHPAGRKHSMFTFTLCANHHALVSRKQRGWPAEWLEPDLPIEKRLALMLLGMSDILRVAFEEMWTGLENKGSARSQ